MNRFLTILKARNLELMRDKPTWIWNLAFPVILFIGVALLLGDEDVAVFKVGVTGDNQQYIASFKSTDYIQFIEYDDLEAAERKLKHHQIDLLVRGGSDPGYWLNESSPKGYLLEKILLGSEPDTAFSRTTVSGRAVRYLDWVLPGILAINIMHGSLFGVGYAIVRYRKNGVLKRLSATPLSAFQYLSAQVVSRLGLLLAVSVAVFVSMRYLFDIVMLGSHWLLLLVAGIGSMAMISLGLLVASRTSSEEAAAGLLNLLTWPMVFLSGVWFSLEGAPDWLYQASLLLPLTYLLEAARSIMIDGQGFSTVLPQLGVLLAMTLVFLGLASMRFKWKEI